MCSHLWNLKVHYHSRHLWVLMLCSVMVCYQCFGGLYRWRYHGHLKCWYVTTTLYTVTGQKALTWIFTIMKTSNLICYCIHKSPPVDPVCCQLFTCSHHWTLFDTSWIQSIFSHPCSVRSILILSSHLYLGLWSGPFPLDFLIKILYAFLISPFVLPFPPLFGHVN
jgi:hypothetical protein